MRTVNGMMARVLGPAVIMTTGLLTAAFALNVVVRIAHTSPRVGDILAFVPSRIMPTDDVTRLLVNRQNQLGCILDVNVLRQSGGSLVVETRPADEASSFRVHWAGVRTSDGPGNCGSDAELLVDHQDLEVLASSIGGDEDVNTNRVLIGISGISN